MENVLAIPALVFVAIALGVAGGCGNEEPEGGGGATTGPATAPDAAAQSASPNVILIVTDDQPYGSVDRMPFLSAEPSFTDFTAYYDNNPLCCPTRATLLTGLYSHNHRIVTNLVAEEFDPSSTLATWLQGNDYETALFGKYLNLYPWSKGADYIPPGWDSWAAFAGEGEPYYEYTLLEPDGPTDYGSGVSDYSTDVIARKAAHFIKRASEPFFLLFSPSGPHAPRTPAPRHETAFDDEPVDLPPNFNRAATHSPGYWAELPDVSKAETAAEARSQWETLLSVDDAVKGLFDAVAARGELDDTIVIFLSDNGYALGAHRNRRKDCPYEECIHVPLLVRWPAEQTGGAIDALVSSVDIAPTIAEMTGTTIPAPVDGESLVPLLTGAETTLDRPVLLQHVFYEGTAPSFWGIRTEKWMYAEYDTGETELYDLESDPYELTNLAGEAAYAEPVAELAAEIERLRR